MAQTRKIIGTTLAWISRLLLGATFVFSGFVKAIDPLGTTYKIEDYLHAFGGIFTHLDVLAFPAALLLIAFEFVLGVMLLLNVRTDWTAWLALVMMLFMTPLTLYLAIENPVTDCGCFGDALVITNWQTFWKNVVLLVLIIVLLITKRWTDHRYQGNTEWYLFGAAIAAVAFFMAWNLLHLPVIDFRPYKIGTNIEESMEIPDDAPSDKYEVTFIYQKDGQQQEFTLENYPRNDSTWKFVEQKVKLVQKGYVPPIHDFTITDFNNDEDITYDVLQDEKRTVIAVMYDLRKTSRGLARKLDQLYEQTIVDGDNFFALVGNEPQVIEDFIEEMATKYPFCVADPVTLKTIVRANPGIVVIENGVIVDKYNIRNR